MELGNMSRLLISVLMAFMTAQVVYSWPEGAPFKMCVSRFPSHHGLEQQTSDPPYELTVSNNVYNNRQDIEVIIKSKENPGQPPVSFKGFQINARRIQGDTEECVGEFRIPSTPVETNIRLQFWYPEKPGQLNCATHRDNSEKSSIRLLWRATSSNGYGPIAFRAGIVKDVSTFWSDVRSEVIYHESPGGTSVILGQGNPIISEAVDTAATQTPGVGFSTAGCGTNVGCFLSPPNCRDLECTLGAMYEAHENTVKFKLLGPDGHEYVSLALSKDTLMGEDDTMTCISSDKYQGFQRGYNPGHYNDHHRNIDVTNTVVVMENGRLICSYDRLINSNLTLINEKHSNGYQNVTTTNKTLSLLDNYYIHLTSGGLYKDSSRMRKHITQPVVSPSMVDLREHGTVYVSSLPILIRAHALLAFLAWITLSGYAMIISRHCRSLLSGKIRDAAVWFQLHRFIVFGILAITSIFIIIVFAFVGGWSKAATIHAVLGLITFSFALIQTLIGLRRPGLTSASRPTFNIFHRVCAIVTQLLAITTMVLGTQVSLINPLISNKLTTIVLVSAAVQIVVEILLEVHRCKLSDDERNGQHTSTKDSSGHVDIQDPKQSRSSKCKKNLKFGLIGLFFVAGAIEFVSFTVVLCLY